MTKPDNLPAVAGQHPALATMPPNAVARGVSPEAWHVMKTVLFKGASDEMVCTLLDYCKARKLDPLKKPFHIVQVWDSEANNGNGGMVESIWPSVGELRTTAMRTGEYAGKGEIRFGPDRTETLGNFKITFPEWAQCTIFRVIKGERVEFAGSPVYWLETFASIKSGAPNKMWKKRPRGQLAKCAEAEALRSAFPEETGTEPTAEEMEGQPIGPDRARDVTPGPAPTVNEPPTTDDVYLYDAQGVEHVLAPAAVGGWIAKTISDATDEDLDKLAENNRDEPGMAEAVTSEIERREASADDPSITVIMPNRNGGQSVTYADLAMAGSKIEAFAKAAIERKSFGHVRELLRLNPDLMDRAPPIRAVLEEMLGDEATGPVTDAGPAGRLAV